MLSIVIADDEAGIVDLCKMLIEYPNAAVIGEAFNGLELFDKIGELHPNTVITDLSMPGMTGLELIEQAKTAYPDVNFIIMSGYTDFEYVQKALRFGVWDYLLKPLQKRELNSILEKLDQHLEDVYSRELRQEAAENDLARSLRVLRERYLRDVWQSGLPLPAPVIGENLILEFAGKKMRGMLFCADWQYTAPSMDRAALERQAGKLFSHLRDGMSGFPGCPDSASFTEGNTYAVLSLYPSPGAGDQAAALEKQLSHLLRELQNQWSGVRVVCACSELLDAGPGNIPLVFEQVRAAARQRIEERGRQILAYRPEAALSLKRRSPAGGTAGPHRGHGPGPPVGIPPAALHPGKHRRQQGQAVREPALRRGHLPEPDCEIRLPEPGLLQLPVQDGNWLRLHQIPTTRAGGARQGAAEKHQGAHQRHRGRSGL